MNLPGTISIGQIAQRTGLSVSAVRYYESQGLITPDRNRGGQRRFLRSDIRRLSFVLIAQQFGFSIRKIRYELDKLPNGRTPTVEDWSRIGVGIRQEIEQKIDTLQRFRDNLDGCIGCGCLSLEKCALYNKKDRAEKSGSGPRYLMGDRPPGD